MKAFHGIEWLAFNHVVCCRARIAKYFTDYYTLDYARSGSVRLRVGEGAALVLQAPVAWWTYPGPFIRFEPATEDGSWNHRHISFRGSRVQHWLRSGLIAFDTAHPALAVSDPERFAAGMDDVMDYLTAPDYGPERAVQLFEGVLLQWHEQRRCPPPRSSTERRVQACARQMELDAGKSWDFAAEARRAGISVSHFRLMFRRLTGQTPAQWLVCKRMQQAALLLRREDPPIKEIAASVGYEDIHHFSKLFKKHHHTPPGRFRQRCLLLR